MSSNTSNESKPEDSETTTTEEPVESISTKESIMSILAGMLVATSLFLTDLVLILVGNTQVMLVSISVHFSVLLSTLFVTSLVGGYYVGKARLEDSSLIVITFGGMWTISVFVGGVFALGLGSLTIIITVLSLMLGGIGLAAYRYLQGDKGIDGMFQILLLACTALNMLYFAVGG